MGIAALVAAFLVLPSAALPAVTFAGLKITSDFQPIKGNVSLSFSGPTSDPADIEALDFDFFSEGTFYTYDEDKDEYEENPITHHFIYGLSDVYKVTGLVATGGSLTGLIELGSKLSTNGLVGLADMYLDFTNGRAEGFCGINNPLAECTVGGGSSSWIGGDLAAVIPLPAPLALLAAALAGLGFLSRPRRAAV